MYHLRSSHAREQKFAGCYFCTQNPVIAPAQERMIEYGKCIKKR
nr:MAG TPA: hypothetical protein [Caudoviricetes sp.]